MNLRWLRLGLALLWLVPGIVFLVMEWTGGPTMALPLGRQALPLSWLFLLLGAFNLALWCSSRRPPTVSPPFSPRKRSATAGSDPRFQFDDEKR